MADGEEEVGGDTVLDEKRKLQKTNKSTLKQYIQMD